MVRPQRPGGRGFSISPWDPSPQEPAGETPQAVVGQVRRGFYPYYDATYVSVPYVVGLGLGLGAAGLLLLGRWHRDILNT